MQIAQVERKSNIPLHVVDVRTKLTMKGILKDLLKKGLVIFTPWPPKSQVKSFRYPMGSVLVQF